MNVEKIYQACKKKTFREKRNAQRAIFGLPEIGTRKNSKKQ